MFVFKKSWLFAIAALAILFGIGGFVLYYISQPNETVTVYSLGDPLSNDIIATQLQKQTERSQEAGFGEQPFDNHTHSTQHSVINTKSVDLTGTEAPQVILHDEYNFQEDWEHDAKWEADFHRKEAKDKAHTEAGLALAERVMSSLGALVSILPPEERQPIRNAMEAEFSRLAAGIDEETAAEVRKTMRSFWDGIPSQAEKTPEQIQSDLELLASKIAEWSKGVTN